MTMRKQLLSTTAGILIGGILFGAAPAWADLPVVDIGVMGILQAAQQALTNAISSIGTQITNSVTHMETSVSDMLRDGFTQNANYAKAQVAAQQQIADASNTANARVLRDARNSQIRDEQTPNPQACAALDNGQSLQAAAGQATLVAAAISNVMDPRSEGAPGTPAYYGAAQSAAASTQMHLSRYCDQREAEAGLCTLSPLPNGDQRAASLFSSGTLNGETGVNAANDFATNLVQPVVPAALRGDQLTSVAGQDAAARRRSYTARMSLARDVLNYSIAVQAPSVTLTAAQQQQMQDQGQTPVTTASWLQAMDLEVNRRVSSVSWAASLQAMPPASVQREIALEMAMSNYLAMQNYRVQLYNSALQASLLAATAERNGAPPVQMPSPSIASN
ncbi:hypothetical protein QMO56_21420 [Roseomonas sp. E05]|uniref:hypothetical protein n=1 Tax=Roseomonas sp. E05 TaxID=3046310 RepID=UPI0024B9FEAD|nr:hypothetical protein [Roseomonas sp. E05]MDJ0390679.1 hypothetical protein [Roseomonas sp. E05]